MPVEDIGLDVIQALNRFIRWRQAGSNFPKKVRPAFGGRLAAREPVWDGEGWGCDRVAGS
jgi:hypothetical protein